MKAIKPKVDVWYTDSNGLKAHRLKNVQWMRAYCGYILRGVILATEDDEKCQMCLRTREAEGIRNAV